MKKILLTMLLSLGLSAGGISKDKQQHAFVGVALYGGCYALSTITDIGLNSKTCLIPVFTFGIGKELYDRRHKGHSAELMDAVATVAIPLFSVTILEW